MSCIGLNIIALSQPTRLIKMSQYPILSFLSHLPERRRAWVLLFLSAFGLLLSALYFQHGMDLKPCVKCIYQRTAVVGILVAAIPPMLINNLITRTMGFAGWAVSAIWGFILARQHVEVQNETNPFIVSCDAFPQYPSFMPLHEWLPNLFGAPGSCGDINWQFWGMSMPEWMMVIFALYSLAMSMVLISRLVFHRMI